MATIDQRAEQAARSLRAGIDASTDIEFGLNEIRRAATRAARPPEHRWLGWRIAVSAAAVVAVLGGLLAIALWTPSISPTWDSSPTTTPGTSMPSTSITPSTSTSSMTSPSSSTSVSPPPTPPTAPAVQPQANLVLDITAPPTFSSPTVMPRCDRPGCPTGAAKLDGQLAVYDPAASTLNLGFGASGPILLPIQLGAEAAEARLLAFGPQNVAYFEVTKGPETRGDVVAVVTEGNRAGSVIGRTAEVTDPSGDTELVPTRPGLVAVGCCALSAIVPDPAAPVAVPWLDADGAAAIDEGRAFASFHRIDGGFEVHRQDPTGPGQTWTVMSETAWRGMPSVGAWLEGDVIATWTDMLGGKEQLYRFKVNGEIDRIEVPAGWSLSALPYSVLADNGQQIDEWYLPGYTSPADVTDEVRAIAAAPSPPTSAQQIVDRLIAQLSATTSCENPTTAVEIDRTDERTSVIEVREGCDDSIGGARYEMQISRTSTSEAIILQATRRWLCIRSAGGDACV